MQEEGSYKQGDISNSLFKDENHETKDLFFIEPTEEEKELLEKKFEKVKNKKRTIETVQADELKKKKIEQDINEKNRRSIFVGNINFQEKDTSKLSQTLSKLFSKFGDVESIRFRSIAVDQESKLPRKAAVLKEKFAETKKSVNAYIVFKDEKSCKEALQMNAELFEGRHLMVDLAIPEPLKNSDHKRTAFLGNLPFDADEEDVWKVFEKKKLKITKVRIVRDEHTMVGKGFGFITFVDQETAKKAVSYEGLIKIRDKKLRISHSDRNAKEKKAKKEQNKLAKEKEQKEKEEEKKNPKTVEKVEEKPKPEKKFEKNN